MNTFLIPPDKSVLDDIKRNFGEDSDTLQKRTRIFEEWLRFEPHLPADVDENLIQAILRSNEYDLEKSKQRFEQLLSLRTQLDKYYTCNFDEKFFKTLSIHKQIILYPILTSKGQRIVMQRFPKNVNDFKYMEAVSYFLLLMEYLIYEDTYKYLTVVIDLNEITAEHIAKINIADILKVADLVFNLLPLRIAKIYFFPLPAVAETIVKLSIRVMNEATQKLVHIQQDHDMLKFLPKNFTPKDYGGNGMNFEECGDMAAHYFLQNQDWIKKTRNFKLTGPIPTNKEALYSFRDEVERSIKNLSVD